MKMVGGSPPCIRYNVLNLPDTIQFGNGRQIINSYDAGGHKLTTQYYTPIGTVIITQGNIHGGYTTANSILRLDDYCGRYLYENGTSASNHPLTKILTPEGYVDMSSTNDPLCYFERDHLGSIREVTSYTGTTGTVVQQTQYYPSGTTYAEGTGAGIQPFKFTGKELITMHGLNWQDFGARWLDNVRMQWTTMDPLCEKYYAISPYTYCSDDPAKNIDPDGREDFLIKQNKDDRKTNAESTWLVYPTGTLKNASIDALRSMSVNAVEQKYGKPEFVRQGSSLPDNPTKSDNDKTGNATVVEGRFKYTKGFISYTNNKTKQKGELPALILQQGKGVDVVSTVHNNYKNNGEKIAKGAALHAGRSNWQRQVYSGQNGTLTKGSEGCPVTTSFEPIYNKVENKGNVVIVRDQEKYEN